MSAMQGGRRMEVRSRLREFGKVQGEKIYPRGGIALPGLEYRCLTRLDAES